MERLTFVLLAAYGAAAGTTVAAAQSAQPVDFTQVTRPVVEVTDSGLIAFLLFELIIEPLETPTKLQVIDVTQNGYGPDDVIVVFPTVEAFLIPEWLPDSVQTVMSSWTPEVEYRLDSGNLPSEALAALIGSDSGAGQAENAIMYDVVQAVERNYRDLPVGILFERDSVGFTFQMWDYQPAAMQFTPRPAFVADSTVTSVLDLLKEVGYLPTRATGLTEGGTNGAGNIAKAEEALARIRVVESEQKRQLAARTVLLGSYDFDRSGSIDAARELDATSCETWVALDASFPDFLNKYGLTDTTTAYVGNIVLSISERVRAPAGRRGRACLDGEVPPPTQVSEVAPAAPGAPVPASVAARLEMDAAAEVVVQAGPTEPGSVAWASAVRTVLLDRFDADRSGSLDTREEVDAVPCTVWMAVRSTHGEFATEMAFDRTSGSLGDTIGVDAAYHEGALVRIASCDATVDAAPRRVRLASPEAAAPNEPRPAATSSPVAAAALSSVGAIADVEDRQHAAMTWILASFDPDRSGLVDTAHELNAMSCDVWQALEGAFPAFVTEYGFVEDSTGPRSPYRGSLIFGISARLREPAARRATACLSGQAPPTIRAQEIEVSREVVQLPSSLHEFLDTGVAAQLARAVSGSAPASVSWATAVRGVLLEAYDFDRSGLLDRGPETESVPCVVWNTLAATNGGSLAGLGFDETGQYLGHLIGVDASQRTTAVARIRTCSDPDG